MSSMDAVTIENYQEAKTPLKDLADTLSKYKKKIQNPAMLSTVVSTDKFIERLDKNEVVFAQEAVDSIKLILDLWDKAKIDNDPDFSMMENISAEINHLSQDPVYEALSEGYKASLLKEGMMKSFREYVDEADAPDVAKAFKEAIKLENWDLAGINYGYLYALTQKRRRAEEQAKQEAQMEAMKSLAKTTAKVTGEAAKGVGKASVGVAKGAAVAGAAAYAANKVAKNKPWHGTCRKCNHYEERQGSGTLKTQPKSQCPKCGQFTMSWTK
tara:strand:- start:273 stop:1082 length:810 start_codon:yes stop_codon:yes gene_type:complete